ncbi:MAG: IPT/TIG domain-containing protein, partial [Planctomycetes bacterium]|nr:IPT/TIG domain-containing protein [Planctomycetota bacterium]
CVTPAGAQGQSADIVVTIEGEGSATLTNAFAYDPFVVSSINPSIGPATGGTLVTVTGIGFNAATPSVTFGANDGVNVTVVNDSTLTVETPMGTAGISVDVTVTSTAGTGTLAAAFNYSPFLVFSVVANNGPAAGGNTVTLNGVGFSAGTSTVVFGANAATNVTVISDGSLTCDVPPGNEDTTVNVAVMNDLGVATLVNGYSYDDFALDSIMPANGPVAGGEMITLSGLGFATGGALTVTLGGNAATGVTIVNDTTVTALTPAGLSGTSVDVVVTSGNGVLTLTGGYTYDAMEITGLDFAMGPAAGGNTITIVGVGLDNGAATVIFGANPAANVAVVSDNGITCDVPAGVIGTSVDVWVMNSNGSAVLRMSYTYQ